MTLIYLAARYSRLDELNRYARQLRALGHRVEARWLLGAHQIHDGVLAVETAEDEVPPQGALFAQDDFEDLHAAGLVICFTEPPRSNASRGGRHVEFGIALGLGKPCWLVGPRENVFYCLPQVRRFRTWEECKAETARMV